MREKKAFEILSKIMNKESISRYERELIYTNDDGSYTLFGAYNIKQEAKEFVVTKHLRHGSISFTEMKNAVTWVTLDMRGRFLDANRVFMLDELLAGAIHSANVHDRLCKTTKDIDQRSIYLTKLNEDRLKKRKILNELDSYIRKCKEWQLNRFEQSSAK